MTVFDTKTQHSRDVLKTFGGIKHFGRNSRHSHVISENSRIGDIGRTCAKRIFWAMSVYSYRKTNNGEIGFAADGKFAYTLHYHNLIQNLKFWSGSS